MKQEFLHAANDLATKPSSKIRGRLLDALISRSDFWDFKLASRRNRRQRFKPDLLKARCCREGNSCHQAELIEKTIC
jgi:hypothetical protein